jgi:long-chain acyl-CoA synthetase
VSEVIVYGENDRITAEIFPVEGATRETIQNEITNLNRTLPPYKSINSIKLRDTPFPKTASNKIKRFA